MLTKWNSFVSNIMSVNHAVLSHCHMNHNTDLYTLYFPHAHYILYQTYYIDKSCFSDTYNNATLGVCLDCPDECGGSCTGPDIVVGSGGCDSCRVLLLDQDGNQVYIIQTV